MKRVMVVVEIAEEPKLMSPNELRVQLERWAESYGATVLHSAIYDQRDIDRPVVP